MIAAIAEAKIGRWMKKPTTRSLGFSGARSAAEGCSAFAACCARRGPHQEEGSAKKAPPAKVLPDLDGASASRIGKPASGLIQQGFKRFGFHAVGEHDLLNKRVRQKVIDGLGVSIRHGGVPFDCIRAVTARQFDSARAEWYRSVSRTDTDR